MHVSFFFTVKNLRPKPKTKPRHTKYGWIPPWTEGSLASESQCFFFDGRQVFQVGTLPPSRKLYSTRSVYHDDSRFWAVPYNAAEASVGFDGPDWQRIGFEHDHSHGLASWVGLGGEDRRLRKQHCQKWTHMLFPENHQPLEHDLNKKFRGLGGELPILLALIIFSAEAEAFLVVLRFCLNSQKGHLATHSLPHGRYDGRGVVVSVFTAPNTSTPVEIEAFEQGRIFND
ncbi:hypothetical protein HDK64DRAFT_133304 [Phyllosticta capitalensis]|uniref:Uncharacterized protein n=2 Tax=Phyllosticta capitalensis TaxID=121624 RepID=A0ABR1YGV3_9PEZI